ncbi:MAG: amidohydrolase family protein [Spirochaetia bacterium]|jgi:predicted TIM-barrel fold metal-dependent hydrolase|nr:amidohydrolase family protein [Spirochaetia bacterium]
MNRIDSHLHFGTIDEYDNLMRYQQAGGFDALCLLSLPVPGRINFNPECLAAKIRDQKASQDTIYALGSLDLAARGFADQIRLLHALGFDGVKLWEGKPEVQAATGISLIDDDYLDGLRTAVELSMPVVLHVADPPDSWAAKQPACPSYENLFEQTEHMLQAVPGLRVVFPHLIFLAGDLPRLTEFMERWPDTFVDLSPGRYYFLELARQAEQAREFFSLFRKRILFGTDTMFFKKGFQLFSPVSLEEKLTQLDNLVRYLTTT